MINFQLPSGWRRKTSIALLRTGTVFSDSSSLVPSIRVIAERRRRRSCRPNDSAVHLRFRVDHPAQYFSNRISADQYFAGLCYEVRLRFVELHDGIEIAGVEMLLENPRPIFRFMR